MDLEELLEKDEDLTFLLEKVKKSCESTGTVDDEMKREFIKLLRSVPDSEEDVAEFCRQFGDPDGTGDVGARGHFSLNIEFESFKKFSFNFRTKRLKINYGSEERKSEEK